MRIIEIRVRDSDPLGPRLAERGLVARAARACRRCAREALQYSPTHTIVWGMPITSSRYRGYLEVITPDSDARRVQRPHLRGHCRAEELGCLHPNRDYRPRRVLRANAFAHSRADAGGDEGATRLCGSSPVTSTSTTKTCSKVCKPSVATKCLHFGMTECSHGRQRRQPRIHAEGFPRTRLAVRNDSSGFQPAAASRRGICRQGQPVMCKANPAKIRLRIFIGEPQP